MPLRRRDANAKQLNVRMPPDELKSLDVWIKTQPAPRPTRAEAIRRLVGQSLAGGAQPSQEVTDGCRCIAVQFHVHPSTRHPALR